jgi:hypothetical protein
MHVSDVLLRRAILLNSARAETRQTVFINTFLPIPKFFDRQCVAATCLIYSQEPASHSSYDLKVHCPEPQPGVYTGA